MMRKKRKKKEKRKKETWGQTPIMDLIVCISLLIECPKMNASPLVGRENPHSMFIVVLFPAPFWPRRANLLLIKREIKLKKSN